MSFLRFCCLTLLSLGWDCPEDIVSIGVLEEVSSLCVSFRFIVSVPNKLPLFSVWVPVVIWRSIGIEVSSPEISSTSTVLVAWDCMAGLVSCAVSAGVDSLCYNVRLAHWDSSLAQVMLWFLGKVPQLAWLLWIPGIGLRYSPLTQDPLERLHSRIGQHLPLTSPRIHQSVVGKGTQG